MNILVVSQYFYPENFRINDLCSELVQQGNKVTVLTGIPNYPEGKFYNGYSLFKPLKEEWNGIEIIRVPIFPRLNNKIALILNYFSFVLSGCFYAKLKKLPKYDLVYVFEVSPVTVAFPAITYKKKHHVPIIMNVQDLWPENIQAVTGLSNPFILKQIDKMVDYIYEHCDLLLTSSQCFVEKIVSRGHSKNKVQYWPQYASGFFKKIDVPSSDSIHEELDGEFNVVFTGNIGYAQGLDVIVDAANSLKNNKAIKWHFVGDGRAKEELENKVKKLSLTENVNFWGRKPESEMPKYLSVADAALLVLKQDKVFEMTLPAKLQTYFACEIPVLASIDGEAAEVVKEAKAGYVSPAGDAEKLAEIVLEMFETSQEKRKQMGANARSYFDRHFDKEKLLRELNNYMIENLSKSDINGKLVKSSI